ncbi:hypothetical protein D3C73_1370940 [compost metagenome]
MAIIFKAEVFQALALFAIHAFDPHHMPLAGTQRADQVTQAVVLAAMTDDPGHGRRAAGRALAEAVAGS